MEYSSKKRLFGRKSEEACLRAFGEQSRMTVTVTQQSSTAASKGQSRG